MDPKLELDLGWRKLIIIGGKLNKNTQLAPSSLCEARQKLPEVIFKILNQKLIDRWHKHRAGMTWRGHKVFAIDGSKINGPRGLLNYGYNVAKDTTRLSLWNDELHV